MAAGSAGLAGCLVEVGDCNCGDANARAILRHGGGDGVLFGAGGEAVGSVFDVAAGDDGTVRKQDSGADAETAVGRVRVAGCRACGMLNLFDLLRC